MASVLLLAVASTTSAQPPFSFENLQFWVGSGTNRAALVIDWRDSTAEPPALAWGYRWDGSAHGSDMLQAIVAADDRLFAKFGGTQSNPNAAFGLGYDANGDGQFALDDGTAFNDDGIAFTSPPDLASTIDPGDYYAEGWFTGFWHYGIETPAGTNPYDGGQWSDILLGMASRTLTDGAWDSWTFTPTFNFAAYAENPQPALPPFSPGDFNHDRRVDAADYGLWRSTFGSMSDLPADANGNGAIDAADYVVWRNHFDTAPTNTPVASRFATPEPNTLLLIMMMTFLLRMMIRRRTRITTNRR